MQYYTVPQKVILSPEMYSDLDTAKDCNRIVILVMYLHIPAVLNDLEAWIVFI